MQTRNLKYSSATTVDMEINHPNFGWIPFTASPNDSEQLGRDLYAQAIAGTLGTIAAYVAPLPTIADFTNAVQAKLDAVAHVKNYDSMLSCISYKNSTNTTFAAEATSAISWRDAVWSYCNTQLAAVQAGTRAAPTTTAAFIAELPIAPW